LPLVALVSFVGSSAFLEVFLEAKCEDATTYKQTIQSPQSLVVANTYHEPPSTIIISPVT
jgi:hypothetical protein